MFETAFTALGSYFSPRFLLGQFLPVFVVLSLNLLLLALYYWGWAASLDYARETLKLADLATAIGILASISCAIAFTLAPLLTALQRILEGSMLPERMRNALIDANRKWAEKQMAEIDAIHDYSVPLDQARHRIDKSLIVPAPGEPEKPPEPSDGWLEKTITAGLGWLGIKRPKAETGDEVASAPPPPDRNAAATLVADATTSVVAMEKSLDAAEEDATRRRWNAETGAAARECVEAASKAIIAAYSVVGADVPADLRTAQDRFIKKVRRAVAVASRLDSDRKTTLRLQYVPADPRPTRFGNLRAALENYTFSVYGAGFDYFWPRIQLVIEKDDPNAAALTDARTQLDYTLLAMLLAMLSCAFWLITLGWSDDRLVRFLIVALASWLLFHLFYRIALEAQRALTEITKAIVDRYRLDLLTKLSVARPSDNDDERAKWRVLADVASGGRPTPPMSIEAKS